MFLLQNDTLIIRKFTSYHHTSGVFPPTYVAPNPATFAAPLEYLFTGSADVHIGSGQTSLPPQRGMNPVGW